jgi:hypothetical protein
MANALPDGFPTEAFRSILRRAEIGNEPSSAGLANSLRIALGRLEDEQGKRLPIISAVGSGLDHICVIYIDGDQARNCYLSVREALQLKKHLSENASD